MSSSPHTERHFCSAMRPAVSLTTAVPSPQTVTLSGGFTDLNMWQITLFELDQHLESTLFIELFQSFNSSFIQITMSYKAWLTEGERSNQQAVNRKGRNLDLRKSHYHQHYHGISVCCQIVSGVSVVHSMLQKCSLYRRWKEWTGLKGGAFRPVTNQ